MDQGQQGGVAPAAPAQAQPVVPASNIKVKPGVIIGIVGGVLGLAAVLLVVFLVVLPMFSVSAEDYDEAYELSGDVSSECSSVSMSTYTSGTSTSIKNSVSDTKEQLKDCDDAVTKLSEAKAIQRDGEAKKLYDDFNDKYTDYKKATDIAVEAMEEIVAPMADVTKSSSSTVDGLVKYAGDLKSALNKIDGLKYDENKKFLSALKSAASNLETSCKKYQAAYEAYKADWRNNDYPSYTDSGIYDAQSELTDATSDWRDDLSKLGENSEPSKPLSKLRDYLSEKN
ncbi:MAG: hypothetical protein LBL84_00490 [Candidatus Nomurabacteria bacterium]|jgi:TolA-binding protein|nr:hypothetical protein [Candidatus Nomurabacteria bacterium]